jgi:predicted HAD superfamily phosphohydrolase YqeG
MAAPFVLQFSRECKQTGLARTVIYTVYDSIFGDILANNAVYALYIYQACATTPY